MNNFWGPGVPSLLFNARSNDTVRDTAAAILPRGGLLKRLSTATTPAGAILTAILCFLAVSAAAQPANDNFANALVISGTVNSTSGSNIGATLEAGETNQINITSPAGSPPVAVSSSVWFQWTNAVASEATFTTIGSTDQFGNVMGTVLAVWTGSSVSSLTLVASSADAFDDFGGGFSSPNSIVTFLAQPGTNYYVSLDLNAANGGQPGNYVLNWNAQTPINDDLANAFSISGTSGTTTGSDLNATMETNEPATISPSANSPIGVGNSIWYQWRAPQTEDVTFDTFGSTDELGNTQDTVIGVWTGNSVTNLVFVGGNDNLGTNLNSQAEFFATAGQTYDIAVYVNQQSGGLPGDVVLNWAMQLTNTPASGTFQFTSPQYQFSENEDNGALHADMRTTGGPRVTITRIGGADGMADVTYYFTNTLYTNWSSTVTYQTNSFSDFYNATNDQFLFSTNGVTTVFNITQVYQDYDVVNPLNHDTYAPAAHGFFYVTNLSSALLEESFSNGNLISFFFTNGLPYVTNLGVLQAPIAGTYTNSVIDTNTGIGTNTFEFWITNDVPLGVVSNTSGSVPTVEISTNYLTYTNLTITNFISSDLGGFYPKGLQETAVFNDYQMNYDIIFPFLGNSTADNLANPLLLLVMTGASLDPNEDQNLPAPQVSPTRNVTLVSLYNDFGVAEGSGVYGDNALTNNVFNFERSTLRCDKTVNNDAGGIAYIGVTCPHHAGDQNGSSVYWRIDYSGNPHNETDVNNWFTTQAGSDYARPVTPGGNAAFTAAGDYSDSASPDPLTWGANDGTPKFIAIPISQDSEVKFNRDITVELYYPPNTGPQQLNGYIGKISTCTLTILMTTPPAGSVDTSYMAENNQVSGDPNDSDPGANGQVNAVVVQNNGDAVIGGAFTSVNAPSGGNVNFIARLDTTGVLDPTFQAEVGGGFINETPVVNGLAIYPIGTNQDILAVGDFTSPGSGIARFLASGAVDPAFNTGFGANSNIWAVAIQTNGQIVIGGDFTQFNGTNCNHIARLNPDGSLDTTFNPGVGPNGSVFAIAVDNNNDAIVIGGAFSQVDGTNFNNITRLNADGSLDGSFSNLDTGASGTVDALAVQTNDLILVGGDFTSMGANPNLSFLARLNPDGSADTNFESGIGPNNTVCCINLQSDGTFYIGGYFTHYNQTRREGIARILPNGWLDTSFMDTANNQFAGVVNNFYSDDPLYTQPNAVFSIGVEAVNPPEDESQTNDIIIGGSFYQVGGDGGLPFSSYTTSFNREAPPHPRGNVARLIGGSTTGPGDVTFTQFGYSANNSTGGKFIQLGRDNGDLGVASVYFEPIPLGTGPGYAQQGVDYSFNATAYSAPTWGVSWSDGGPATWMLQDGLFGILNNANTVNPNLNYLSTYPVVNIISNNYNGTVGLNLQLASPRDHDTFFLGGNAEFQASPTGFGNPATAEGENIALGVALGNQSAPLSIQHTLGSAGQFSFTTSYYYTNENATFALLTVTRSGGSSGTVTMNYSTGGGTAVPGRDYYPTNGQLRFQDSNPKTIAVQLINYFTNQSDRVFGVNIFGANNGGTLGPITNANVEIVNDNIASGFAEFVNGTPLSTNVMGYGVTEKGGIAQVSVARLGGSSGVLQVTLSTQDGSAKNGQNYSFGSTNLTWNSGNVGSPVVQTVNIPILDSGSQSSNVTFKVNLSNALLGNQPYTNFSAYSNAVVTITNSDLPGTVEFSSPSYTVNEDGGSAIIPIVRTGGTAGSLSVQINTINGTATNGVNYQGGSGTIVFAAGQVSTNVVIPINNLNSPTALNFFIALTNAAPATGLGSPNMAQVTINGAFSVNQPPGGPDPTYDPSFNAAVFALALQANGDVIAGGEFTLANGVPRQYIARLGTNGTLDTTFSSYLPTAGAEAPVDVITIETNGLILVGGIFTNFNNSLPPVSYITRLNVNGSSDAGFNTGQGANNPVYAIAQTFVGSQSRIVVGGSFTSFNGSPANGIVQLFEGGGVDPNFSASANATVWAVAVQPNGQVLIGGDFTNVDGMPVNHIARLNANGALDFGFTNAISNPLGGAAGSVRAITLQLDGRILIGGFFTNVDGVPCNYIARLNSDGSLDKSFANSLSNPAMGANGPVSTISVQSDSHIIVGGQFTEFNGVSRNNVTRLNADGTTDLTVNFGTGADGPVNASVIQADGNIVFGGGFTNFDNSLHQNIVRVWGRSVVGSGSFGFSTSGETVSENGSIAPITVVRYGGTAGPNSDGSGNVTLNVLTLTNSGTAVPNVNYTPVSALVSFPPGEVQETVNVPLINDAVTTPSQWTVSLLLTNPTPSSLTINALQNTNTLTILNTSSFISFSSPTYSVVKDDPGGAANINLVLTGYTNSTSSVVFSTTTGGTAVSNVNYVPVPPTTVTFNPGVTNVTVQVPVINVQGFTGNQTVTMALTNASNAYLVPPTNATLTIEDLGTTAGQIYFASSNYNVNISSGQAVVSVLYTNGDKPVTVGYTTVAGTAQDPANYTTKTGTLGFGNGTYSNSITVKLAQNTTPEGPVSFSIVLDNPTGGATLTAPTNTTVNIVDDISTGVSFVNATNFFQETNGVVSVFVQRLGNTATNFSVSFTTTNGTANSNNYVANNGTLTFDSGDTLSSIKMTLINNEDVSNVFFGITLLPPANPAVQLMSPSNTVVVVTPAAAGITFTSPTNSVFKSAGSITIPVVCLDPSNEPVILDSNSIPLSVSFTTADGTATSPSDYLATNGVLTFTNGMVTNWITVSINNNNLITGLRTFNVRLFNPQPVPPAKTAQPTNDVVTIIDSNAGLSFSSGIYSIDSGGVVTVPVIRQDNTNIACTVAYATTPGGTAVANNDYIPVSGTLTFAPGQTSNSFTVETIGSQLPEPDKTILLALSDPTNAVLTTPSAATITIVNLNGSYIVPAGVSLQPGSSSDGILQSNQPVVLNFGFRDAGGLSVSSMTATLLKTANITPDIQPPQYGAMTVNGHSVFEPVTLTPIGTNGQTVSATFQLTVNAVGGPQTTQTNSFALTIGSYTTTWSNTNSILFSPNSIASLYPSVITVSNVGGVLVGVTATITNYSDQSPPANELLLVSPSQLDTLLMAGDGSNQLSATHLTLTFSNCVPANPLPAGAQLTNGVYNPTQHGVITPLP